MSSATVPDSILERSRMSLIKDRKSTRLNSSHLVISYAVFCLKKKNKLCSDHKLGLDGGYYYSGETGYCTNPMQMSHVPIWICAAWALHHSRIHCHEEERVAH